MNSGFRKRNMVMLSGLTLVMICILIIMMVLVFAGNQRRGGGSVNMYDVHHFDTKTESTSRGVVKMNKELERDFIMYRSEEGVVSTISKFGGNKFVCHGTCKYGSKEIRLGERRSANAITKSLFFVASAISLTLAIQMAQKQFHDECRSILQMGDDPSDSNPDKEEEFDPHEGMTGKPYPGEFDFYSDVDVCKEEHEYQKEFPRKVGTYRFENTENELYRNYECTGHCMANKWILEMIGESSTDLEKMRKAVNDFDCESYSMTQVVQTINDPKNNPKAEDYHIKRLFERNVLVPYCESISKYSYTFPQMFDGEEWVYRSATTELCIGSLDWSMMHLLREPFDRSHVECKDLGPVVD